MDFIYDINRFIFVKTGFSLPIPIKNRYYKRKRLNFKKRWYCLKCNSPFNLPKKNMYLSDICCPSCKSSNVAGGTAISKAVIDKKSPEEIKKILSEQNKIWEKIENAERNNPDNG
ncbi:MAG: hypothetical protein UR43_C0013G0014 [candidate division TM6 bacterium GW2011_GWF2_33_332]|nr:MAG: hypothetical protein UR43_C0013G0014 [candidate division TM6 bacterium GW2011_GWF2_33_332]